MTHNSVFYIRKKDRPRPLVVDGRKFPAKERLGVHVQDGNGNKLYALPGGRTATGHEILNEFGYHAVI